MAALPIEGTCHNRGCPEESVVKTTEMPDAVRGFPVICGGCGVEMEIVFLPEPKAPATG